VTGPATGGGGVAQAFDEARFGPDRVLNLRASLPTGAEATRRAESWLRERQAAAAGDVLVITGRGRGSLDGVPIVREAIVRLFPALRRVGVIASVREHTPGSFVVRLASLQSLVDAPRRRARITPPRATPDPGPLTGLDPGTVAVLRRLSLAALTALGVQSASDAFVADEMVRQFSRLAATLPPGPDREGALRALLERALEEFES
jgi:hypothetical protein